VKRERERERERREDSETGRERTSESERESGRNREGERERRRIYILPKPYVTAGLKKLKQVVRHLSQLCVSQQRAGPISNGRPRISNNPNIVMLAKVPGELSPDAVRKLRVFVKQLVILVKKSIIRKNVL
jgi:hypothetical protein